MAPPDVTTFANGFRQFLDSGKLSDIVIVCSNRKFAVHKIVIFAQSKVLEASCASGFKESETNTIDLTHDGLHLLERMIGYFYSGTYAETLDEQTLDEETIEEGDKFLSRLTLHVEMYSLADKYDVSGLMELAIANFQKLLATSPCPANCVPCVRTIYQSTPDSNTGLRDVIVNYLVENYMKMLRSWQGSEPFLKAEFIEVPQFGWDFFVRLKEGPEGSSDSSYRWWQKSDWVN